MYFSELENIYKESVEKKNKWLLIIFWFYILLEKFLT
jgi:hypothetical protein